MTEAFAKVFIYLIVIISLASCATKGPFFNVEEVNIENVLTSVKDSHKDLNTLKGLTKIRALNQFESVNFNQATLLKSPDRFRLEALAVFGQTVAVVISDGKKVYFKTSREELIFEDSESFNLSYFYPDLPSDLKTDQLVEILFGKVPFGLWDNEFDLSISAEERTIQLSYINSNGTKTILSIDPIESVIRKAVVKLNSGGFVEINYSNFSNIDNRTFPRTIDLLYSSNRLSINYIQTLSLNARVDESLFSP